MLLGEAQQIEAMVTQVCVGWILPRVIVYRLKIDLTLSLCNIYFYSNYS